MGQEREVSEGVPMKTKLYEVPRNSKIKVEGIDEIVDFHHIDGMYSYCTVSEGVIHLAAWTEVEIVEESTT
jgi:hypothetical protein